jgi:hypothetical protein
MAKQSPPSLFCSGTFSFNIPFPRLGWEEGAKLPEEDDPTTTSYGMRFLEIAHRNLSRARPGVKDVPDFLRKYQVEPGRLSIPASHRAFWLNHNLLKYSKWIDAVEQLDKTGDKEPLLALCRSQLDPVFLLLTDVLERYNLRAPQHRPKTPIYDRTSTQSRLFFAREAVRAHRAAGKVSKKLWGWLPNITKLMKTRSPTFTEAATAPPA